MKQLFLFVILFATTAAKELQAQTIADTLEMAYSHFSKKEYQSAAVYFDHFLSKIVGQSKDYYLAGVCNANTGNPEKSLEYLNKAANGKVEYFMMLNDPELEVIRPRINEIVARFAEFDKLYKLALKHYPRNNNLLLSADSLYQLLPPGKIDKNQLRTIAWDFLSNVKDTVKFFYYLNEQLLTYQNEEQRKELTKEMERQVKTFKNKLGANTHQKLLAMGSYRYFYAMTFVNNTDSLRYHLSKVPYEISMKYMPVESYIGAFEYFTEQSNYNLAFFYLYSGLANKCLNTKKIFDSRACNKFFRQPLGKAFLIMLLSESLIPTVEMSDRIFVASAYGYTSSDREKYEFLKAMEFNTRFPGLKKYLVSRNIYGLKTAPGKSIIVSDSYPHGLYEDELRLTIDSALNVTVPKKNSFDIFNPKDEVLLVKNTPLPGYTYTTGEFYRQPVANIAFIMAVKNGKVKKSIIPSIRASYFQKLVPYGIKSIFYDNPDRDDIRYFAFEYGYNTVELFFEEMMRSPRREDIEQLAEFIPRLAITHTKGFDFLIRVLENPEQFMKESKDRSRDETYYNLKKVASHYIEDLAGSKAFEDLQLGKLNRDELADEAKIWKDAAAKISGWWQQYKKENPYVLPSLLKSTITEQKGLPERTKNLLMTASNKLLFYNPAEKEITSAKKETKREEDVAIMMEEVESLGSSHRRHNISGIMIGDTGYVFSPNHRDRPDHLSIVPGLSESELNTLKQVYENLGLSKSGRSLIGSAYDKSFDKFFVYRYNKQLAIFWFNNVTLYGSFLDNKGQLGANPVTVLYTHEMKCNTNGNSYNEIVYNINSLQFEKLGNNLLLVCNVDIRENPECDKNRSRIYVALLGPDLQLLAERTVTPGPEESFGSEPETFVKTIANNAYVLVQDKKATNKVYSLVYDQKLNPVTTFSFDQNIAGNYDPDPLFLVRAGGENMYCLYSQDLHGDVLLGISKIGPGGLLSKPLYLYQSEGSLTDYKGYFSGGNFVIYLIEHSFQKDRLKKITIPAVSLKFNK